MSRIVGLLESPGAWSERRSDNDDPKTIDWTGFNAFQADSMWKHLVKPAAAMGFDDYSLQGNINWRWSSPWRSKRQTNFTRACPA